MRPSTLALGTFALIAAAASHACRHSSPTERAVLRHLLSYEGENLVEIEEAQALFDLVLNREPIKSDTFSDHFEPWEVLRLGSDILLLEGRALFTIPGECLFRAHLVSEDGFTLSTVSFSGGWRILISHARSFFRADMPNSLLELSASSVRINGGADVAKQFYAGIDDHLALVRLEDSRGRLVANSYDDNTIGPPLPPREAEAWERALMSSDDAEILRTLMWIGGRHREAGSFPEPDDATVLNATRARAVRQRPGVRARLEDLKKHPNAWIREAAAAVN
ncbi:MAG TPA: hypothetical protein VF950_06590 [Planctomycetota bacterium]